MTLTPTPTERAVAIRCGDFDTLIEALEYAADAGTGASFHDGRGRLQSTLTWAALRDAAEAAGKRLAGFGLTRGDRIAIVAETHPDFLVHFFGARYAGLVPVPLPASIHMGGHQHYVELIGRMLVDAGARCALATEAFLPYLHEASVATSLRFVGTHEALLAEQSAALPARPEPEERAYIQYTSGSTRFPRGAVLTERAALRNVVGIARDGLAITEADRFCSWLPLYHDMGLVGKMIVPIASQCSIDYLGTREFAMRPRLWPRLISDRGATISFAPPFGFELTARRLRPGDAEAFELSRWRIAGCGADMIRPDVLENFAEAMAAGGFDPGALMPSYGMAEVSLAVSFTPRGRGLGIDAIDGDARAADGTVRPTTDASARFTRCGRPLPDYRVEIRDEAGTALPELREGSVFLSTPSTMEGYHESPELNREILRDGWLDTGDLGYLHEGELVLTGRRKDLIIVNGRNIWPQDVEHIAEQFRGVRTGDAAAFTVDGDSGPEVVVLLQCREQDENVRENLLREIQGEVRAALGIDSRVTPVPPHSLPKTTSGKLSRARARQAFLDGLGVN